MANDGFGEAVEVGWADGEDGAAFFFGFCNGPADEGRLAIFHIDD